MESSGFCKTSPGLPSSGSDSPASFRPEGCGGRSEVGVAEDMFVCVSWWSFCKAACEPSGVGGKKNKEEAGRGDGQLDEC